MVVRNCAMIDGALFWLLIPFMTVAFCAAALLFLDALLGRRGVWAWYALLLGLLAQPFVQIYTQPQLYAYNHIFGMFLGLSWDQSQPPFLALLLYRVSTLAYAAVLLLVTAALRMLRSPRPDPALRRRLALAFLPALAAVLFFTFSDTRLGLGNSYAHLRAMLGSEYRLDGVRIVYDASTLDSAEVRRMAEEHLFQLDRVRADLGVNFTREVTSYVYPDDAVKRRLLGTETSDVARPWRAEIHVSVDSWPLTVKHELVHVVAGSFGPWLIRTPFVRALGLTEGLAMAVEWSWGGRTLHEYCAGMLAQDILPRARTCIGTAGFATRPSTSGYVAAGSLTRWLMDSLGVAAIRRAYAADDLEKGVGMSYEEIDRRWRIFLAAVPRTLPDSLAVAYAFRRPSLFSAECPRALTERNRAAAAAMQARRHRQAAALYREADRLAPNARSAFGLTGVLYAAGRWDSVIAVTARYLGDTTRAYAVFPLYLWQGAALWNRGDSAGADRALTRLLAEDPPGWPTAFAARMRRALRSRFAPELRGMVTDLLRTTGEKEDSLRRRRAESLLRRAPEDPVLVEEYMRATAVDTRGRRKALRAWRRIASLPVPAALRLLAVRLHYEERQWSEARRLLRHQLNEPMSEDMRNVVTEWLARCAWQQRRAEQKRQ
jgi:tetratricopeptide (TPR) repeat protein